MCDGLSKIADSTQLDKAVASIAKELDEEGFDYEDIVSYLVERVTGVVTNQLK